MTSTTYWSVVVVGAGPTGLTLANLLVRYRVPVLLVERNPATVQEPRAVSIDDESLRTMQAIGVVDSVLSRVVLGYGSEYFSPSGKCFLRVMPKTREYGYPRRNAFHQPVLEAQLCDYFQAQAKTVERAEAWFGAELIGFAQHPEQVVLQVRRADGTITEVACSYLAACDGARSFVRESLGIAMSGSTFRERWLIIDLEKTNDAGRDTKVFCNPARPCITLPGPGRTRRFEFMLHPQESDQEVTAPDFVAALLRLYSSDDTSPIRRRAVYTFHARMAERWRDARVFLAGDAAHLSPPFAGQGMNSGVRDAHNLAWKLAAVVRNELGPGVLRTYEMERRGHAWEMIRLALRMGRVMMPRGPLRAIAMQATFRLLGLSPAARDYFAEMKYKPKPRFRTGFIANEGAAGAAAKLIGGLLPQPVVEAAGPRDVLLDDALGTGFALLATPGTPPDVFKHLPEDFGKPLTIRRVAIGGPSDPPSKEGSYDASDMDRQGDLSRALAGIRPGLLLLRPDRYVAAFLAADNLPAGRRAVERLIASTWRDDFSGRE